LYYICNCLLFLTILISKCCFTLLDIIFVRAFIFATITIFNNKKTV
jgi:hypothetical protein